MITAAEARAATNKRLEELTDNSWKSIDQRIQSTVSIGKGEVSIEFDLILKDQMFKKLTELGYEYNNRAGNVQHNGKYAIKISW